MGEGTALNAIFRTAAGKFKHERTALFTHRLAQIGARIAH